MNCPACQGAMTENDFGGVQIDVCTSCKGLWFDVHEIKKLDEAHEGFGGALNNALNSEYHKVEDRPQIKCVRCQGPMVAHNYQSQKMITVDECYACGGFFLDAGELEILRKYHMSEDERDKCIQDIISVTPKPLETEVPGLIPRTEDRRKAIYKIVNSIFKITQVDPLLYRGKE